MRFFAPISLAAAILLIAGGARADHHMPQAIKTAKTANGEALTNAGGMTLYTFDKDKSGVSNCYDRCAKNWPPMPATANAKAGGEFTVVERKDGSYQWAYKGMPLYTWIKDSKPGDMTGDGFKGVWHIVRP